MGKKGIAMSLKQQLAAELNRLGGAGTAVATAPEGTLTCEVTALDAIGCSVLRVVLESPALASASIDELKQLSDQLSARLSYLLEKISPMEIDQEGVTVQMRSSPPQKDDDGTSYYELLVRRGGLSLCRYRKAPGGVREVIPAHFTREVLTRLADDFVAAAAAI